MPEPAPAQAGGQRGGGRPVAERGSPLLSLRDSSPHNARAVRSNCTPRGDLRVISIPPLPPLRGGRCRRQRGAPGAPSPDSGSSPPSLRDTATGREGRSSRTYAQVSLRHAHTPLRHSCAPSSFLRPFRHSCAPSVIPAKAGIHATPNARPQPRPPDGPPHRPHKRSGRLGAVEYPTYARHPAARLDSCLRRNDGRTVPTTLHHHPYLPRTP